MFGFGLAVLHQVAAKNIVAGSRFSRILNRAQILFAFDFTGFSTQHAHQMLDCRPVFVHDIAFFKIRRRCDLRIHVGMSFGIPGQHSPRGTRLQKTAFLAPINRIAGLCMPNPLKLQRSIGGDRVRDRQFFVMRRRTESPALFRQHKPVGKLF